MSTAPPSRDLRKMLFELIRFGSVGGSTTLLYFGLVWALAKLLTAPWWLIATLASGPPLLVGYLLHRSFTFKSQSQHKSSGPRFLIVQLSAIVLNGVVIWLGVDVGKLPFVPVQLLAIAVQVMFTYAPRSTSSSRSVTAIQAPTMSRADRIALGAALAVPWLFIWQGLDFTDQGYLLTGYRCFLRHPEVTRDSASLWLTNLIGALWDAAFGWLGLVGMRALWALCMSGGALLAFRLVRGLTSERAAAVAVLASTLFLSDRRETWFSYNTSSALLFVVASVCLAQGIIYKSRWWLLGAGAVIGALPFARIPNVLAAGLPVALLLSALLDVERRRQLARDIGFTALGVAAGVGATLFLIYALGDAQLFVQGVRDSFAPASQSAGYSAGSLFDMFVREESKALACGFGVCLAGALASRAMNKLPAAFWPLGALAAAAGWYGLTGFNEPWSFVVPGTAYWVLGAITLGLWRRNLLQRVVAFIALMVVVIAPLGSNNGIKNAHMGLWLALPLLLALLANLEPKWLAGQGAKLALLAGLALCSEAVHQATTYTYRDLARTHLFSSVAHPQLRAQLTSAPRAKVVAEVLAALDERVAPGDYLLAYEGTPLLQYLTKTRPYLNRPWVMGLEGSDVIAQLAAEAPRRTGCLPVVVVTTKSTRNPDWPQKAHRLEEKEPQHSTRLVLRTFMREHRYSRKWSNGFFEIFEPPASAPGKCR